MTNVKNHVGLYIAIMPLTLRFYHRTRKATILSILVEAKIEVKLIMPVRQQERRLTPLGKILFLVVKVLDISAKTNGRADQLFSVYFF